MGEEKLLLAGRVVMSASPGREMRKVRQERGISQGELSRRLGIHQSTLSDYEGGRRKSPGMMVVKRFIQKITEG